MPAPNRPALTRAVLGVAVAALTVPALASCAGLGGSDVAPQGADGSSGEKAEQVKQSAVTVAANVAGDATDVKPNRTIAVSASDGTLRTVRVHTLRGAEVKGSLNADRTKWVASQRLDAGRKYKIDAVGADSGGVAKDFSSRFDTMTLTKDQQTYPNVYPTPGSTVGVAMPISVTFTDPVTDRKRFEQHMHVTTSGNQKGAWHWIDDTTAHYRPKAYWKADTKVNVDLDLKNVEAGGGLYGQISRNYSFNVSRALVMKVDLQSHHMKVLRNGKLERTLPVTAGMSGFTTRSGTKVISELDRTHDMDSTTIGIANDAPLGYNLKGVEFAMRLTNSGEFIHAAPWSVGSQGVANVSHGCTGLSTANAGWLFNQAMVGDPVEYVGSDKPMTLTNGYGDWNESWADWVKGQRHRRQVLLSEAPLGLYRSPGTGSAAPGLRRTSRDRAGALPVRPVPWVAAGRALTERDQR